LRRRSIDSLRRAADPPTPGTDLQLDTCVYIDVLQGRTPTEVDALLQLRTLNHLSVCVAESFAAGQELAALNATTLYLHAAAHGQEILTRNVRDFDMINQILPEGRVLFYGLIE
jgi:hypothetical protein